MASFAISPVAGMLTSISDVLAAVLVFNGRRVVAVVGAVVVVAVVGTVVVETLPAPPFLPFISRAIIPAKISDNTHTMATSFFTNDNPFLLQKHTTPPCVS